MTSDNNNPTIISSIAVLAATFGAIVLAVNNPSEQDFRRYISDNVEREVNGSNNGLAKFAMLAFKDEFGQALSVKKTNFIVFSRFELTLPYDASGESYCYVGFMNDFRPCKIGPEQPSTTSTPTQQVEGSSPSSPSMPQTASKASQRIEPSDDLPANGVFFNCGGLFLYKTEDRQVFGSDDGYEFYTLDRGGPDGSNYTSSKWPHSVELNMAGAAVVSTSDGRRLDCSIDEGDG